MNWSQRKTQCHNSVQRQVLIIPKGQLFTIKTKTNSHKSVFPLLQSHRKYRV